jgi:hypothetical protein
MPTSKIMSNRDPTFTQEPKRIFMLAEFGNDFGRNFADAFRERLTQLVNACGTELHIEQVSTVEIDDGRRAQQIKTFAADVLLSMRNTKASLYRRVVMTVDYDVDLYDIASNKTVWKATIAFDKGDELVWEVSGRTYVGEALARDLVGQLKKDGILRSCPATTT